MSELVQALKDAIARDKEKISQLKAQIFEDKNKLSGLDAKYNELVLQGNDSESDKVFNQLFELKRDIEKNERKLQVLNSGQLSEDVKKAAQAVLDFTAKEQVKLNKALKQKKSELTILKEQYFNKLEELGEVIRNEHKNQMDSNFAHSKLHGEIIETPMINYRAHQYLIKDSTEVFKALNGTRKQ
ncbi:MAG TPA: hypothetical protein VNM69_17975 [Bacillus sp. (in: firmicutes)]|nr:hypothetical protein [Bacillus sp. (in: firmicutes)]